MIDTTKVTYIEVADAWEYPDFCDAYISSATYDGREVTEAELEELNEDRSFVYEAAVASLF
jgi:hypothetical protein